MGIPSERIILFFQGQQLNDQDTLDKRGVGEGELIFLNIAPPRPQPKQGGGGLSIADMIKSFDKNK